METKSKQMIKKIFSRTVFKDIIVYKNPNECNKLVLERVNPDHIGIVWGQRKKGSKGQNMIKIAKVFFSLVPCSLGFYCISLLDGSLIYVKTVLASTGFITGFILIVGLPLVTYAPIILINRRFPYCGLSCSSQ
jgi:hypothetical protein